MAEPIDEHFTTTVAALTESAPRPVPGHAVRNGSALTVENCLALFDAQLGSRHLDLAARWLRSIGKGYYTIGSSGHEGNVAVAAALRPTDPALLHYRSGGFFLARAQQVGGRDALRDVLLGLVAATEEPIAGGRHKVFGRHDLNIIPQTSTIASHLPRAVGVAFSIARARKLGVACPWPADAVTVCSFGDASVEPFDGGRRHQRRVVLRVSGIADAAAVRLRRQRDRHQHQDRAGLGRTDLRAPGGTGVLRCRRLRSAGNLRRRRGRRGVGPHPPATGIPASAHGAAHGARRFGLRTGLSAARRDRRRLRPRPGAVHRETVDHPWSSHAG